MSIRLRLFSNILEMEVIRIPQVRLVDAFGKDIGVYTDDPDWWQRLKNKSFNEIEQEKSNETSHTDLGSNVQLIKNEKKSKRTSRELKTLDPLLGSIGIDDQK